MQLSRRGSAGNHASARACVGAIAYAFPETVLTNEELAGQIPRWSADDILLKTGIRARHIATVEKVSDLAVAAAEELFASSPVDRSAIDLVLLCTESADHALPPTACLLQDRLGLPTSAGAFDFNLGCSGYVYGLAIAKAMIESGLASQALLLTSEIYTRYLRPKDASTRTLFGDGASATWVSAIDSDEEVLGPFVFGTDGSGGEHLMVRQGADPQTAVLHMNGPEIFNFSLTTVPKTVDHLLAKAGLTVGDIDLFVFHQANQFMLEHLRKKIGIPEEKFVVAMEDCGNTVSSTIPIGLARAVASGRLCSGMLVALVGFGVGYSWGAAMVRWTETS